MLANTANLNQVAEATSLPRQACTLIVAALGEQRRTMENDCNVERLQWIADCDLQPLSLVACFALQTHASWVFSLNFERLVLDPEIYRSDPHMMCTEAIRLVNVKAYMVEKPTGSFLTSKAKSFQPTKTHQVLSTHQVFSTHQVLLTHQVISTKDTADAIYCGNYQASRQS
eukprot:366223-Chlamydomonas_euryale.AAC.1